MCALLLCLLHIQAENSHWQSQHPELGNILYTLENVAGLEIFFIDHGGGAQWGAPSAFFAFPNTVEANKAAQAILAQPCLGEALPGGKSAASAAGSILEVLSMRL